MPSPFPGMDPYLEDPRLWPSLHTRLITVIADTFLPQLSEDYYTLIEERVYIGDADDPGAPYIVPDVSVGQSERDVGTGGGAAAVAEEPLIVVTLPDREIREAYVTIRDRKNHELVAVVEVLSPSNKIHGSAGWRNYVSKREAVTTSATHFVEIDLLRGGERLIPRQASRRADYLVHVSPAWLRPKGQVWPIRLPDRLPTVPIPLKTPVEKLSLDLQEALTTIYERGGYNRVIDYAQPPDPPLTPEQAAWAKDVLANAAGAKA